MVRWPSGFCVGRVDEIPERPGPPVEVSGLRLALFRDGARWSSLIGSLPARRRLARPGLGRGGRSRLPAPPLAVQARRRPMHDDPRRGRAPVPGRDPRRRGLGARWRGRLVNRTRRRSPGLAARCARRGCEPAASGHGDDGLVQPFGLPFEHPHDPVGRLRVGASDEGCCRGRA